MKVYLVCIRENEKSVYYPFEGYYSFEKAKKHIFETQKKFDNRKVQETDRRNEFLVTDNDGKYIHTLVIEDIWVR